MLLLPEEVFGHVVGTFDDGDDDAIVVALDGVTEEAIAVALEILEDDRARGGVGAGGAFTGRHSSTQFLAVRRKGVLNGHQCVGFEYRQLELVIARLDARR